MPLTVIHGFDIVTVRIQNKGRKITGMVVRTQARSTMIPPTGG